MIKIPLQRVEKQSLSIVLDNAVYDIAVLECNGIMAVTVVRDNVTLVQGRRAVATAPVIPAGPRVNGNLFFATEGDALPYWTDFGAGTVLYYLSPDEIEDLRNG